jgi:N-methylhydantoinase B
MASDPFTREIIRSYLASTLDEMTKTTARAAYSTTFSEGLDFSCAIFDVGGRMVAQAAGIATHLGALRPVMVRVRELYDKFEEGDVIVTNDPYLAKHQPDVVVVRPMFWGDQHVGFAVNVGHWADIGGMAFGGTAGTSTHVVQDGLIIPVSKIYSRGALVREIYDFISKNVRYPREAIGDLQSQIAACRIGELRLRELVGRYGLDVVQDAMDHAIDYSRKRFLSKIAAIPDGTYYAEDYLDDDGVSNREYLLRIRVEKTARGFVVDLAGSAPQARTPINSNYATTCAAIYAGLIAVVDPEASPNEGIFGLIEVKAPEGSVVNARWPASVLGAGYEVSKRVCEMVLRAVARSVPDRIAAGSYSSGNNIAARCVADDGDLEKTWYSFTEGGLGAWAEHDGNSGIFHWHSTMTNQPIEIWEQRYPVLFKKYALLPDSGGPGKFRGGLGTVRHIECLWDHFLSGLADRQRIPPWGLDGGHVGRPNRWAFIRDGAERTFKEAFDLPSNCKFYDLPLRKGDILVLETGGGGGFGDPSLRDPKEIDNDLREGYISSASAYRQALPALP